MKKEIDNLLKLVLCVLIFMLTAYTSSLFGQSGNNNLPQVFFIGEHQEQYDQIIAKHSEVLLSVHDNSMEKAFNHWTSLLNGLETYAEKNGLDIKGVKIWINVFWDTNGKIKHLAFYPKPNSKNIDYEKMKLIVTDYIANYNGQAISSKKNYSHFGTANFPVFARLAETK